MGSYYIPVRLCKMDWIVPAAEYKGNIISIYAKKSYEHKGARIYGCKKFKHQDPILNASH